MMMLINDNKKSLNFIFDYLPRRRHKCRSRPLSDNGPDCGIATAQKAVAARSRRTVPNAGKKALKKASHALSVWLSGAKVGIFGDMGKPLRLIIITLTFLSILPSLSAGALRGPFQGAGGSMDIRRFSPAIRLKNNSDICILGKSP